MSKKPDDTERIARLVQKAQERAWFEGFGVGWEYHRWDKTLWPGENPYTVKNDV
jgi:hypothetical protein